MLVAGMSWLTPKHVDDVQRILRGVALVVARAATDSRVVRRAAAAEQQRVLQYAADFLAQQQHGTQAAEAAQPEPKRWRPQARSTPILHTLQEPSLEQMAGPAGLQPPSPDPLITQAILASASTSAPPATSPAAPQAAAREGRQQAAVQPALHASPAPVATAAATASTSGPGPAGPAATSPPPQAAAPPADAPAAPLSPPQPSGWASAGTAAGLPPAAANKRPMRERRVPASPMGRALGFAGMGATLMLGTLGDAIGRTVGGIMGPQQGAAAGGSGSGAAAAEGVGGNAYLTAANAERLANALSRMRGAALKIGQMLSIQDESLIPPQVQAALERVRAGADVMPRRQLEGVLVQELGADWRSKLAEFDPEPRAAASIGQVHAALLHDGRRVAMKVQYPGVARGIVSDIDNLMRLIRLADILPKGLYVENAGACVL